MLTRLTSLVALASLQRAQGRPSAFATPAVARTKQQLPLQKKTSARHVANADSNADSDDQIELVWAEMMADERDTPNLIQQKQQQQQQQLPLIQLAVAGSLTTFGCDMIMHPIDCIKVIQQSDLGMDWSLMHAASYLYETDGVAGFFHGFFTYACSDAAGGALKFAVWESWKTKTADYKPAWVYLWMGAALAFLASSIVIVPGEFLKQQLQMSHYTGLREAIDGIYAASGIGGFFMGYDGVLYRDIPYTMLELGLYEIFKEMLDKRRPEADQGGEEPVLDQVLAAAVTGAITATLTTPLDTIKTKLMVDDYSSFLDALTSTVEHHGPAGVFAGVVARIAWIVPFTAIYLPTYDFLKRQLWKSHLAQLSMSPPDTTDRI